MLPLVPRSEAKEVCSAREPVRKCPEAKRRGCVVYGNPGAQKRSEGGVQCKGTGQKITERGLPLLTY